MDIGFIPGGDQRLKIIFEGTLDTQMYINESNLMKFVYIKCYFISYVDNYTAL